MGCVCVVVQQLISSQSYITIITITAETPSEAEESFRKWRAHAGEGARCCCACSSSNNIHPRTLSIFHCFHLVVLPIPLSTPNKIVFGRKPQDDDSFRILYFFINNFILLFDSLFSFSFSFSFSLVFVLSFKVRCSRWTGQERTKQRMVERKEKKRKKNASTLFVPLIRPLRCRHRRHQPTYISSTEAVVLFCNSRKRRRESKKICKKTASKKGDDTFITALFLAIF